MCPLCLASVFSFTRGVIGSLVFTCIDLPLVMPTMCYRAGSAV